MRTDLRPGRRPRAVATTAFLTALLLVPACGGDATLPPAAEGDVGAVGLDLEDFGAPDASRVVDLATPAPLPPDAARGDDLTQPAPEDLSDPPDFAPPPDLATPPDATVPPDLVPPPVQCIPQAEVCDGKDNDCDKQVDEGYVCPSSLQVVTRRVYFKDPDEDQVVQLVPPNGANRCVPLVAWERTIEHADDQCDFRSSHDARRNEFTLLLDHCNHGIHGSPWVAVAHIALLCPMNGTAATMEQVFTNGQAATNFNVNARNPASILTFCSLDTMDGEGDTDIGASCLASRVNGQVSGSVAHACGGGKAFAGARIYGVEIPPDVRVETVPFTAKSDDVPVTVAHGYNANSPPHHLAFVIPQNVATNCNNHGSFESICTDAGGRVSCTVRAYGSIDRVTGSVLFIDGNFPGAMDRP